MKCGILPHPDQVFSVRSQLICSLVERGVTYQQIQRLNLCAVMNGAAVGIRIGDKCYFVTLSGKGKDSLNDWQTLRPRGNPRGDALFITLRGKNTGQRMSVSAIRRIARQSGARPLNIRFGDFSENSERVEHKPESKPKLRVIQGGR